MEKCKYPVNQVQVFVYIFGSLGVKFYPILFLHYFYLFKMYKNGFKQNVYDVFPDSDNRLKILVFRFLGDGISSSQITMSSSMRISTDRRLFCFRVDFRRKSPKSFFGFGTLNWESSVAKDLIEEMLSFSVSDSTVVSKLKKN